MTTYKRGSSQIITILIVLVIVAGGIYYFTRPTTPDPDTQTYATTTPVKAVSTVDTTNWKTYTNPKYNFSFKYPADWVVDTETYIDFPHKALEITPPKSAGIKFVVTDNLSAGQTISNYLAAGDELRKTGWEGQPSGETYATRYVTVEGTTGIEREESWFAAGFDHILVTYFKKNNVLVQLSMTPYFDLNDRGGKYRLVSKQEKEIARNIISTFKFTK
jgi:hypothetical protein